MKRLTFIVVMISVSAIIGSCASGQAERTGSEMLTAVDRSFSDIPFGTREGADGLTLVRRDDCEHWGECSYRDASGVEHYFSEHELVVKSVRTVDAADRSIKALGIGTARAQADVLHRVRRFLPEARIDCADHDGEPTTCGAMLGRGWITLTFDSGRRLVEARVDAYQFT